MLIGFAAASYEGGASSGGMDCLRSDIWTVLQSNLKVQLFVIKVRAQCYAKGLGRGNIPASRSYLKSEMY